MSTAIKEKEEPKAIDKSTAAEFVADLMEEPAKTPKTPKTETEDKKEIKERGEDGKFLPRKEKDAPKPEKKPVRRPEPKVDYESIAEATARGVTEAMKAQKAEPAKEVTKEPVKEDPTKGFSTTELRKLAVLEKMEALFPDRHKGVKDKYIQGVKGADEYKKQWELEHPGEEYNGESEEHDPFFEKNAVSWDEDDYNTALAEMIAERRVKEYEEKTGKKLSEFEEKEKQREFAPLQYREAKRVGRTFFSRVGGVFKDIIGDDFTVNRSALDKAREEDSLAAEVVMPMAEQLEQRAHANSGLFAGVVKYDAKNPIHRFNSDFALQAEQEMLQLPRDKQLNIDGKKFVPKQAFLAMNEEDRSKHYTFTAEDLNNMMAAEMGAQAVKKLREEREKFKSRAVKYGFTPKYATDDEKARAEEEEEEDRPKPVGGGTEAITTATASRMDHKPKDPATSLIQQLL